MSLMHARHLALLLSLLLPAALFANQKRVEVLSVPEQGIQPRTLVDGKGILHLLWYAGGAKGGNLFHATRQADKSWSTPVKVNSIPDSAIAAGTIRGAQFALGRDGYLHVIWNGFRETDGKAEPMPLYYTRSADGGKTFEPQRIVSGDWPMDGGGAVAADAKGKVHVFWHAGREGGRDGEVSRRIFIRSSTDDGANFDTERAISPEGSGVCACCAMQALATRSGAVHVLYRTATDGGKSRDIATLTSQDGGKTFSHAVVDPWRIHGCPMSSMSLVELRDGSVAGAWEREGQILAARFDATGAMLGSLSSPLVKGSPGKGQRKHPVLAVADGRVLMLWAEGTGWNKGGTLAWQVFTGELKPTAESGVAGEVQVWSFGSVVAVKNDFVILR
jgi:hypothetical protein